MKLQLNLLKQLKARWKKKNKRKGADHMAKQVSENKDGNVRDNFEVLTGIQQNAQRLINERLGLNFENIGKTMKFNFQKIIVY